MRSKSEVPEGSNSKTDLHFIMTRIWCRWFDSDESEHGKMELLFNWHVFIALIVLIWISLLTNLCRNQFKRSSCRSIGMSQEHGAEFAYERRKERSNNAIHAWTTNERVLNRCGPAQPVCSESCARDTIGNGRTSGYELDSPKTVKNGRKTNRKIE